MLVDPELSMCGPQISNFGIVVKVGMEIDGKIDRFTPHLWGGVGSFGRASSVLPYAYTSPSIRTTTRTPAKLCSVSLTTNSRKFGSWSSRAKARAMDGSKERSWVRYDLTWCRYSSGLRFSMINNGGEPKLEPRSSGARNSLSFRSIQIAMLSESHSTGTADAVSRT